MRRKQNYKQWCHLEHDTHNISTTQWTAPTIQHLTNWSQYCTSTTKRKHDSYKVSTMKSHTRTSVYTYIPCRTEVCLVGSRSFLGCHTHCSRSSQPWQTPGFCTNTLTGPLLHRGCLREEDERCRGSPPKGRRLAGIGVCVVCMCVCVRVVCVLGMAEHTLQQCLWQSIHDSVLHHHHPSSLLSNHWHK